jgi:hypothetical protein
MDRWLQIVVKYEIHRGRIMEKIEQSDKHVYSIVHKKNIWELIYLLEWLTVKEDCGSENKEIGDCSLRIFSGSCQAQSISWGG